MTSPGRNTICFVTALAGLLTASCNGIMSGIYDEPEPDDRQPVAGQLYVEASSWTDWYYIDLKAVTEAVESDPDYNTNLAWQKYPIPVDRWEDAPADTKTGIYTYWYDVFGEGLGKYEFRSFYPTHPQPQPDNWTFAVHRDNVRTNGGAVAATGLHNIDDLPDDPEALARLDFVEDTWSQVDIWTIQDKMLLGLIGNQGISFNKELSSWLKMDLPPIPPAFTLNDEVFVLRLSDGTMAALQLHNYMNNSGVKCCLTINYKYPL